MGASAGAADSAHRAVSGSAVRQPNTTNWSGEALEALPFKKGFMGLDARLRSPDFDSRAVERSNLNSIASQL